VGLFFKHNFREQIIFIFFLLLLLMKIIFIVFVIIPFLI